MIDSHIIKREALRLGFSDCRISKAEPLTVPALRLSEWLDRGMHGQMDYLSRNREKRAQIDLLVHGAKSVISVAVNYFPETTQDPDLPQIARYAFGSDYHKIIRDMLYCLLEKMKEEYGAVSGRAFTDSAPVLEHAWAEKSGLGWTGKHSLTIHPDYGSYIFLGELVVDLEIDPDLPGRERCGTCTRCMDACPVQAIKAPYVVDARRCLSYLTIEYKGALDKATNLHHRLFGCDICQEACPWNKRAQPTQIAAFRPVASLFDKTADDWLQMSEEEFCTLTKDSPLQRAGFEAIRRNAAALSTNLS